MKASTLAKKLNALQTQREELQAKLRELKAAAAGVMDPQRQRELLDQKQALQLELEALDRAIDAAKIAHKGAVESEAQEAAKRWREDLAPQAQNEIAEARNAVVQALREARSKWDQLREVEHKWVEEWKRHGAPSPGPKPVSKRAFLDFLTPSPTDQEMRKIVLR